MTTGATLVACWAISNIAFVAGCWWGSRRRITEQRNRPMTYAVPFTQYLPPDGRKKEVFIEVDQETGEMAALILTRGFVFECEVLRTGDVSLTITDPEEGDVDIRVIPNGPKVPEAVRDLIRNFIAPAGETLQ
jgi:hypothetical protein